MKKQDQLGVISVSLPWLSPALHAHAKGHWRQKAAETRKCRDLAFYLCRTVKPSEPIEQATINYRFFVPDKRRRDEANMIQACKPYVDGLVDAKVIAGDDWQRLRTGSVSVVVDKENPRVVLEIESVGK